jgi:hypothetical protein
MPQHYADVETAMGLWSGSVDSALRALERFGERVVVLTYEQLVQDTEATMQSVCERVGITMSPVLLEPTFNGLRIRANSSGEVERYGVLPERSTAYRDSLDPETTERILALAGDLYERAGSGAVAVTGRSG